MIMLKKVNKDLTTNTEMKRKLRKVVTMMARTGTWRYIYIYTYKMKSPHYKRWEDKKIRF